jgi:hypothetical protein
MHTKFRLENLRGSDHLADQRVEESRVLKSILMEREQMVFTRFASQIGTP